MGQNIALRSHRNSSKMGSYCSTPQYFYFQHSRYRALAQRLRSRRVCEIAESEMLCCVQDSTGHDSVTSSTADDASSAADKVTLHHLSLFVSSAADGARCIVMCIDKLHYDCLIS